MCGMTYISAVQVTVIVGVGLLIGFTIFRLTRDTEPNSLPKSTYLADGVDYIDHHNHTPVCDECNHLMRESGGKATMDKTGELPLYMRQSYECLNCESHGVVESDVNSIRVSGVVFRKPETVATTDSIIVPKKNA